MLSSSPASDDKARPIPTPVDPYDGMRYQINSTDTNAPAKFGRSSNLVFILACATKANTVAAIRGGMPWRLSRNPFECSLYLDIRTVPGQTADPVKRSLRRALRGFATARGTPEPALEIFVNDPPTAIDAELPVARAVRGAHRRVTGADSPLIMRRPGADSTHFNRYDVPCVVYGPGGRVHPDAKGQMHAVGEHVHVDDLVVAAKVYLDAALAICSQTAGQ